MRKSNVNKIEKDIYNYILKNGIANFNFTKMSKEINVSKRMVLHYYSTKENMLITISEIIYNKFVSELDKITIVVSFQESLLLFDSMISSPILSSQIKFWLELINLLDDVNEKFHELVNSALDQLEKFFDRILEPNEENRQAKIDTLIIVTEGIAVISKVKKSSELSIMIKNLSIQ